MQQHIRIGLEALAGAHAGAMGDGFEGTARLGGWEAECRGFDVDELRDGLTHAGCDGRVKVAA